MRAAAVIALGLGVLSCAHAQPPTTTSEVATEHPSEAGMGWRTLEPSAAPTDRRALRAELEERRRSTADECEQVARTLEDRQRQQGSLLANVFNLAISQLAAGMAQNATTRALGGPPPQQPTPIGASVGIPQRVSLATRVRNLRNALHELAVAESDAQILDALDHVRANCSSR